MGLKRSKGLRKKGKGALSKLTAKLDRVFSEFVRLRDAHEWATKHPGATFGYVACCTCGKVAPWREMHAGHYIGREAKNTRWEEQNVHAQCPSCNTFHEGRKPEYTLFLQQKYGAHIIGQLVQAGKRSRHWKPVELEALVFNYQGEVERMREAMNECGEDQR